VGPPEWSDALARGGRPLIRDAVVARLRLVLLVVLALVVAVAGTVVALRSGGDDDEAFPPLSTPRRPAVSQPSGPAPTFTTPTTVPGSTTATTGAPTRPRALLGVYRGPGPWGVEPLLEYTAFLGREPDLVLDFQDTDTWANQEWPDWQSSAWEQFPQYRMVLGGTGVFPQGGSWARGASGEYDEHWRRLGERLVATGQDDAILRGAHEFNGDWFPYRVGEADVEEFVTAWRRWVDVMRSVPGQRFTFDWNPILGSQYLLPHPEVAWPGDEWVDRVAVDVYDGGPELYGEGYHPGDAQPSAEERDAAWDQILNGERGLVFWRDFAAQHGKPLSFPEWGIQIWMQQYDGLVHGGGDNATFVNRMADIIADPAWNVAYHAFWEHPGFGVSDPDDHPERRGVTVSASRDVFLQRFGGPSPPTAGPAASPAAAAPTATTAAPTTAATTATTTATTVEPGVFYRGVNLNGPDLVVNGLPFESAGEVAVAGGSGQCTASDGDDRLRPAVSDPGLAELLRCGLQSDGGAGQLSVTLDDVANGAYDVSVYVWENDFPERYSLALQDEVVVPDYWSGDAGHWAKLGPFPVTVDDGTIELSVPSGSASNLAGVEIWAR
jgi:hypothetical protein